MRSENLITIILSGDPGENHLSALLSALSQSHFKVLMHPNVATAIAESPASPKGTLIYISKNFQANDFPPSTQLELGKKFANVVFYLNYLPDQTQMETDQFSFLQRETQDLHHKHLMKLIQARLEPEQAVTSKAHDILSAMGDAVISINGNLRIEYMNPTACQLIGTTIEDALGQKAEQLLDLRDPASNKKITQQVFEQFQNVSPDTKPALTQSKYLLLNALDNKQHKVAVRNSTYYNAKNGIESVIVLRDISNKPNISQKFPASDNKYWALVNTTQLGYTIVDKHGKIRDANDEFLRITGHSELQDIIGTDARKWVAAYEKQNVSNTIEQLMKTGKITGMEVDFKANNGALTPIEFNATIIKEKGDYHLLGIGRDISDRRKAEREKELIQSQLRQAQKMESIGQLTGGIAHDFNNVLASILGYTELSQHAVNHAVQNPNHNSEETNKKLETYLGSIHEAGTRAQDLIQQLMVFSRSSEISPQLIQAEPAINEITKLLSSSLPETINVTTHFEKNLPLIHIDPSQLYEVIMYLFYNSRDALHKVGEINIFVSHRNKIQDKTCSSCHSNIDDDYIDITIKDNGPGIPEQHRDRVFEPFYTTKTIGQGTGMGLPMVHGIVHEHGGHILLDSSSHEGTTTHLLFPVRIEKPRDTKNPDTFERSSNDKGHIVIVEDEESLANFLSDLFSSHGYTVTAYTDSLVARRQLPSMLESIDLILTDHTMPGITGTQLAKEILSLKPDLPIILCTGFSFQVDEKTAYAIGIRRFLKKPISSSELLREVEQLIQQPVAL